MKTSSKNYLICILFFLAGAGCTVTAWADSIPLPSPAPVLSLQFHAQGNDSPSSPLPIWSHTDHAILMGISKPDHPQSVDMRLSLDRLHFKSSIQKEKGVSALPSHLLTATPDKTTESMHLAAGIGYEWSLVNQRLALIPMMGLSYHGRYLDTPSPSSETREQNLTSNEKNFSEWNSLWFGLDLRANPLPDLSLESSIIFHSAKFAEKNGERLDVSDTGLYRSEGDGRIFRLGLRQQLGNSWSAGILYSWQQWMAEKGDLPLALHPGDNSRNGIPFNGNMQELNISLSYGF